MDKELSDHLGAELAKVGARLRKMRKERGWTLEDLEGRTGLTKPHLSRIESGERQPSLAALFSVARAYGVPFSSLFEPGPDAEERVIVKGGGSPVQRGNGLLYATLSAGKQNSSLQPLRVVVLADQDGDGQEREKFYRHVGEEWLYVLSGRVRLDLADKKYDLEEGDAAHFDASTPHNLHALDGQDAEIILVAAAVPHPLLRSYL